jgi:hypothetical protein
MKRPVRIPETTMVRPNCKLAGALGVAAAVLSLSYLSAQPPEGGSKDGPGRGFKGKFGPRDDRDNAPPRVDREVEDWIRLLAERIADRHDEIRDSARAALVAIGPAALPTLRRLAEGDDAAGAPTRKATAPGPAGRRKRVSARGPTARPKKVTAAPTARPAAAPSRSPAPSER